MFLIGSDDDRDDARDDDRRHRRLAERLGIAPTLPPVPAIDQAALRLTPGARVVRGLDEPRRSGLPEEILVTLHADPGRAADVAVRGGLLARGTGRLQVEATSLSARHNELRWTATLQTTPWRRRPATLRLYGSPSHNVTILTLTPHRARRVATRSFLRIGMRSMTDLRDRLDEATASSDEAEFSGVDSR